MPGARRGWKVAVSAAAPERSPCPVLRSSPTCPNTAPPGVYYRHVQQGLHNGPELRRGAPPAPTALSGTRRTVRHRTTRSPVRCSKHIPARASSATFAEPTSGGRIGAGAGRTSTAAERGRWMSSHGLDRLHRRPHGPTLIPVPMESSARPPQTRISSQPVQPCAYVACRPSDTERKPTVVHGGVSWLSGRARARRGCWSDQVRSGAPGARRRRRRARRGRRLRRWRAVRRRRCGRRAARAGDARSHGCRP